MKKIIKNLLYILLVALISVGIMLNYVSCGNTDDPSSDQANSEATVEPSNEATPEITQEPTREPTEKPTAEPTPTPKPELEAQNPPKYIKPDDSLVAIVKSDKENATDLTFDDIKTMVKQAVDMVGGISSYVKDGDTVVLKPNLVTMNDYCLPGWSGRPLEKEVNGNCTDYRVTRAVAQLVREVNPTGKIYVMEGSAQDTAKVMAHLNYTKEFIPEADEILTIEADSGKWMDKLSDGLVRVSLPDGLIHQEYYYNKKIFEADVLICLPTLKNHWDATVTGGIKNMSIGGTPANIYGIGSSNYGRNNMVDHSTVDLHKWIADFYMCRPINLTIMDGLQGLENGPTPCYDMNKCTDIKDSQMNMRLILAGADTVAVDTVESCIVGWDPETVEYLNFLGDMGFGNNKIQNITVTGKNVDDIREFFEGVNPKYKGQKITVKDTPSLELSNAKIADNKFTADINVSDDTVKAELYANGKYVAKATDFTGGKIEFDISSLSKGDYEFTVKVYNRFMFESTASVSLSKATSAFTGSYYEAVYAEKVPVIDGKGDEDVWNKVPWAPIDQLWLGTMPEPDDFTGRYKIAWNGNKLYYLVEVTDDVLMDSREDPLVEYWEDDCLEFFIDEDKSGGDHTNNYNAFAYHVSTKYDAVDLGLTGPKLFNDHCEAVITNEGNVYTWEVAITIYGDDFKEDATDNVPVELYEGKDMGFAIAYCDSDSTKTREHFMGSIFIPGTDKNVAYQNASVFGHLKLIK